MASPRLVVLLAASWVPFYFGISVGSAQFEPNIPANVISVTAAGEAKAPPDLLKIQLTVVTTTPLAVDALAQNKKKMGDLLAELAAAGVPKDAIETSGPSIGPAGDTDYEGESTGAPGSTAAETATITFKGEALKNAPESTAAILDVASKVGIGASRARMSGPPAAPGMMPFGPYGGGLSAALFTVSDPDALRAEALGKAVEQARKTAEISAKAMGVKLAGIRGVSVSWPGASPWFMPDIAPRTDTPSGTAQSVSVSVTVTAQFDFTK